MNEGVDPGLFQENERTAPERGAKQFVEVGALAGLPDVTVAYETWGELSPQADNAILIQHALSGDSHAIGWWDRIVGPGKPIDIERFFVIGHNALGGCQGTTGPSSLAPDGKPYGSRFPSLTVEMMVEAQRRLVGHLGVERLFAVAGGSMGGMMALEWVRGGGIRKAILTATAARHSAMQIGFNETARQAILRDPNFRGGDYYDHSPPDQGLAVARMVGHLSYLSEAAFQEKFGRQRQAPRQPRPDGLDEVFAVESYLSYQGDKFTQRFDANSLLVLSRAIDEYDLQSLHGAEAELLVMSFTSDWLYPTAQGLEIHRMATEAGLRSQFLEIDLPWGHDSFLLDGTQQGALIRQFLGEP